MIPPSVLESFYEELEKISIFEKVSSKTKDNVYCVKCRSRIRDLRDRCPKCGAAIEEGRETVPDEEAGGDAAYAADVGSELGKFAAAVKSSPRRTRTTLYNAALHFRPHKPGYKRGGRSLESTLLGMKTKQAASAGAMVGAPKVLSSFVPSPSNAQKLLPSTVKEPAKAGMSFRMGSSKSLDNLARPAGSSIPRLPRGVRSFTKGPKPPKMSLPKV